MVSIQVLLQQVAIHWPIPVCDHPLITAKGSSRKTGLASSAFVVFSMTPSTSLYASGASSERMFFVAA